MRQKVFEYFIPLIISIVIFLITKDFPFYWDNIIQISVPANFYFDNNFNQFFLPNDIATGHPTFVGMYFAAMWKCFGRTLLVSHAAMMPFVFGLIYQIIHLIKKMEIKGIWTIVGLLMIVLLDTTLMSQLSLMTFEIIQLFLFTYCLNQLIKKRKTIFSIAFAVLMLVSLRGALVGVGLILSYFILADAKERFKLKSYFQFIPGTICLIIFLLFFYSTNGWIVHNKVSNNWDTANEIASIQTILKNIAAIGWQIIDYGRVVIFGFLLIIFYRQIRHRKYEDDHLRFLFAIGLGQLIIIAPILIFSQIPFGHRYFLPVIIPMGLFVGYWILNHWNNRYKKLIFGGIVLILISGHFWIYPKKISQGWDSTTLHWQYFDVAESMHGYIFDAAIDPQEIGTFFPAYKSRRHTYLEERDGRYDKFDSSQRYLLYSNAFNVEDAIIDALELDNGTWREVKSFTSLGVEMRLYKRIGSMPN